MSEAVSDVFERSFADEMDAVADTLMGAEADDASLPQPDATDEAAPLPVADATPEPEPEAPKAERRDWKAEAIAATERLKALEDAKAAPEAPKPAAPPVMPAAPDPVIDPEGFARHHQFIAFNERLNVSEMLVREKHADVDEKIEAFKAEAAQNPALMARLQTERHPWAWAYEQGRKALAQREIGDDPAAFRAKLEAEIREKVLAEVRASAPAPAAAAPAVALPPDLSGARSVSGRTTVPPQ